MKIYKTLIKRDHKLGGNDYVQGVIYGILRVMCVGKKIPYGHGETEAGLIIPVKCTRRQYKKAAKMIEKDYKNVCIFDYKDNESE